MQVSLEFPLPGTPFIFSFICYIYHNNIQVSQHRALWICKYRLSSFPPPGCDQWCCSCALSESHSSHGWLERPNFNEVSAAPQPTSVNAIIRTCSAPSSSQNTSSLSPALICSIAWSISFQVYYCNTILLAIAIAFKTNLFRTHRPLSSHNIKIGDWCLHTRLCLLTEVSENSLVTQQASVETVEREREKRAL